MTCSVALLRASSLQFSPYQFSLQLASMLFELLRGSFLAGLRRLLQRSMRLWCCVQQRALTHLVL